MPRAIWKNEVIAESNKTVLLEGNYYFPPDSVRMELLKESAKKTTCPWKGKARYFDIAVNGRTKKDAAWSYPEPKKGVESIRNHLAFWQGVQLEES